MAAGEPLDRLEVREHLAKLPQDAPLADYLWQRLNSSCVQTADQLRGGVTL